MNEPEKVVSQEAFDHMVYALDALVTLSNHYATLLNQHDGGERRTFENSIAWVSRLQELGELPMEVPCISAQN